MKVTTDACLFGALVAEIESKHTHQNILDIGTGTGLLTLMLAQKVSGIFDAVEVNSEAFEEANHNFNRSGWKENILIHHCPIQEFERPNSYDLIICNPPFFSNHPKGTQVGKAQAMHDESLNLLDLASVLNRLLSPTGRAYIMYPAYEMSQFVQTLPPLHFETVAKIRNQPDTKVIREVMMASGSEIQSDTEDIYIYERGRNYSERFQMLLKDYYLYL